MLVIDWPDRGDPVAALTVVLALFLDVIVVLGLLGIAAALGYVSSLPLA